MPKMVFEWDDPQDEGGNHHHITLHGITPADAERIVRDQRNSVDRSRSSGLPITFGRTKEGKFIAVIWSAVGINPLRVKVRTAYEVKPREGRL